MIEKNDSRIYIAPKPRMGLDPPAYRLRRFSALLLLIACLCGLVWKLLPAQ